MEVNYEYKEVERLFTNFSVMQKEKGLVITKILKRRLDEIKASDTLRIYLTNAPGKPHLLSGDKKGLIGVTVDRNKRLILKPELDENIEKSLAINKCRKIIIVGVEDYHGGKTTTYIP